MISRSWSLSQLALYCLCSIIHSLEILLPCLALHQLPACSSVGPGKHLNRMAPGRCLVLGIPLWAGTCPGGFGGSAAAGEPGLVMVMVKVQYCPQTWVWLRAWGGSLGRCPVARAVSRATSLLGHPCSAQSLSGCHLYGMPAPLAFRACCHTVPLPSGSAREEEMECNHVNLALTNALE